jgi:hypothetical protein
LIFNLLMEIITAEEFDTRWQESIKYEQLEFNTCGFDEIGIDFGLYFGN